mgnify:CR=1 FL=1
MLDKAGRYIPPLTAMLAEMRAKLSVPHRRYKPSGKRIWRRQVERDFTPVNARRWSGRQWTKFRKFLARTES